MWSDRETADDFLGYRSYISTLVDVCTHPNLAPLTLGIFGLWGSGKTSLMQMLKAHIDQDAEASDAATLWFNAWRYESRDEAQSALIHSILNKLSEGRTLTDDIKETFSKLKKGASVLKLAKFITKTAITLTPDLSGFLDCFEHQSERVADTMEHFERDFNKLLEQVGVKRLVVFVDDLDRCQSEKVIETFETIKLFLNIPATTFVIGADDQTIINAVREVYGVEDVRRQRDYLEKIIQIPFAIPEQTLDDITCFVGMLILSQHILPDHLPKLVVARPSLYGGEEQRAATFCDWARNNSGLFQGELASVETDLREILDYASILARGLRGNPRQIKRFLNILSIRRRLAEANDMEVNPALMIKLGVLEYVWREIFDGVVETVDPLTGKSLLLSELNVVADETDKEPSPLLSRASDDASFMTFALAEPQLAGDVDLRPYLYLAQTSLGRGKLASLLPADDQARKLVAEIENSDRIVSQSGSKRAAAQDASVVSSVVRLLIQDLSTAEDARLTVSILSGLAEVCQRHTAHLPTAIAALRQLKPTKGSASGLAALRLFALADKHEVAYEAELRERFSEASPLAKAMAPRKPNTGPRK